MEFFRTFRFPLLVILIGGSLAATAFRFDAPVRRYFVESQGKDWRKSAEAKTYEGIREWGDWPPIMAAAAICYIIARARGNPRWSRIILVAMVSSTLAGFIALSIRSTTGRTRPRESPKIEQGFYGPYHNGRILIGVPAYNSFPSGHTAAAFGMALGIALASPLWGVVALGGAASIAWASVALGMHHPSDVTVSICIAALVAWGVWRFTNSRFAGSIGSTPTPPRG